MLHYIDTSLTQGHNNAGLVRLSSLAKHIIAKGTGVYATPIIHPSAPTHVAYVHSIEHRNRELYPLLTGVNFWICLVMGVRYGRVGLVAIF